MPRAKVKSFGHEAQERKQEGLAKKYGPDTPLYKDMEEKYYVGNQNFFYVYGITKEGKIVILGPKMTMREADNVLANLDDGEIFEYKTRDLAKATRQIKAHILEREHNADRALQRVKHKI